MEFDVNDDPLAYETRPIFGMWSKRQAAIGAGLILVVALVVVLSLALGIDPVLTGGAAAVVGVPVGYFGLAKRHGLLPEEWVPLTRAEENAPQELIDVPAMIEFAEDEKDAPQMSKKEIRALAQKKAAELEEDDCLSRFVDTEDLGYMPQKGEANGIF